jgi:outer membrane protein assembly factor BamB
MEERQMTTGTLIIGVGGHAVALDPATGTEIWRTKLKGSDIVTIHVVDDRVFAGAGGELFCLDEGSGTILWRNKLRGLGLGLVAFDTGDATAAAARIVAQRRAAAAAGGAAAAAGA